MIVRWVWYTLNAFLYFQLYDSMNILPLLKYLAVSNSWIYSNYMNLIRTMYRWLLEQVRRSLTNFIVVTYFHQWPYGAICWASARVRFMRHKSRRQAVHDNHRPAHVVDFLFHLGNSLLQFFGINISALFQYTSFENSCRDYWTTRELSFQLLPDCNICRCLQMSLVEWCNMSCEECSIAQLSINNTPICHTYFMPLCHKPWLLVTASQEYSANKVRMSLVNVFVYQLDEKW